ERSRGLGDVYKRQVVYQPLGVVGIIVPWNFPVMLSVGPLITALAAGNRAMIKLSEFTPATNQVLRQLLAEIFTPEQVAVVEGEAEVAAALSQLPFDHLILTGSTAVGRHVMRAAADNP
ncbi:aldehyde dehydrogenase family protein, partial [Vibrio harveyi]|uniref:aldehyde dehydrogenase family protein n=1 Tax=Vibrio harveyi TaxID=669 RepID=UPI0018F15A13